MADKEERINVRVEGTDSTITVFSIEKRAYMKKLMNAYCDRKGLVKDTVRFLFDSQKIKETDTPHSLQMTEGEIISVVQLQHGGLE